MATLPAAALYVTLGVATFIENFFPPLPSDVLTALGAFLTHRGVTRPVTVFLVSWLGNLAGAICLYLVARHYGRAFLAGPVGRRLVSPEALAEMEREYLRFGEAGIFIARLLPGLRSFVAVFVGVINLGFVKAVAPIGFAAGLWYAFLTWAGTRVGEQWEEIARVIGTVNRGLTIAAVVAIAALVAVFLRMRSRAAPEGRLWRILDATLGHPAIRPAPPGGDPGEAAAAALLMELAAADHELPPEQAQVIRDMLHERWTPGEPVPAGALLRNAIRDLARLGTEVASRYDHDRRVQVAERMFRVASEGGPLGWRDDWLVQRASQLLGLTTTEMAEARARALAPGQGPAA